MPNWMPARPSRTDERPEDASERESELVARARVDRGAFAPLYARYLDPVYRYCYRRMGGRQAAEDATGEVFCKALAALADYRDGSFGGWLFTIARNVVADALRRCQPEEPLGSDYDPPDDVATPEELALAAEERRSLRELLARLPADQRSVVELRLSGLTGTEIAGVLGRSLGAVKMLQFRAVAQLRVYLAVRVGSEEAHDGGI